MNGFFFFGPFEGTCSESTIRWSAVGTSPFSAGPIVFIENKLGTVTLLFDSAEMFSIPFFCTSFRRPFLVRFFFSSLIFDAVDDDVDEDAEMTILL